MTMTTSGPPSLDTTLRQLRRAQLEWGRRTVGERLRPVQALRQLLVTEADRLCAATAADVGKTAEETLAGDVLPLADACRFLEREAARLLRPRRVSRSQRPLWLWGQADTVQRRPRGVVGIIGTWNYPLFLNGVQIAQALTAGNAVLWKPSEVAPTCAAILLELLQRVGFPAGVVQVLEPTRDNGRLLVEAAVDHVVFTGSADVGRRIAARLGERLVSSTLELSGVDAQFVLDDADVALAARAAWFGATMNRGQTCMAVRRSFVQRPLYGAVCDALQGLAGQCGPVRLALASQAEQAERLVVGAIAEGGRLLAERSSPPGCPEEWQPAVVADARPEMALCREASFAPLLAVLPFDTIEEVVDLDQQCPYALGASVFTRDPVRAGRLAERLRTGVVTVNDVIAPTAHPATPFGGTGASGWGVTQGAEGLLEMTVPQVVSVRTDRFRPHYDLAAGHEGPGHTELIRGLLESAHAPTLGQRLRGWGRLVRAAWRGM
jgi:acyl-CoA reductase-like NAD-dependent aldehyde dehydrogenase